MEIRIPYTSRYSDVGVYMIRNVYNKRTYVGSSIQIRERWRQHRRRLRAGDHHSRALQNAWNSYGESAFEFFVIGRYDQAVIKEVEQYWIQNSQSYYNVDKSARGRRRCEQVPDARVKISESVKSLWANPVFRDKTINAMRNAPPRGVTVLAFGVERTLSEFAKIYGMSPQLLRYRMKSMSVEEALLLKAKPKNV